MSERTPRPPRPETELAMLPVMRVLRDYPETLSVLRRRGVALDAVATRLLSQIATAGPADDATLTADVANAIAWRGQPCDG